MPVQKYVVLKRIYNLGLFGKNIKTRVRSFILSRRLHNSGIAY
jgi:hypothetical protein